VSQSKLLLNLQHWCSNVSMGPLPNTLAQPNHNPNGILTDSVVFAQMTAKCRCTLQRDAPYPQNCLFPWGIWNPHLIHGSLGPPESSTQTVSRLVQSFLQASLLWQTDRQTDHATPSVTTGCINVHSTEIQPSKNTKYERPQWTNIQSAAVKFGSES